MTDPKSCLYGPNHQNLEMLAAWAVKSQQYGCPIYEYPFWFWVDAPTTFGVSMWTWKGTNGGDSDADKAWDSLCAKLGRASTWSVPPFQRDYSGAKQAGSGMSTVTTQTPPPVVAVPKPAPAPTPTAPAPQASPISVGWIVVVALAAGAAALYFRTKLR